MPKYGSLEPYIPWRTRPLPLDWEFEFERTAPLRVELGFGNGDYLTRCASEHPDRNFVGIEVCWGSVWRALRSTHKQRLPNVRFLLEDARAAALWGFQERCAERITGLFPCPWPKVRHAKFRLFQPDFMRLLNSRLTDDGLLEIVTDSAPYRDQILGDCTPEATGLSVELEVVPATYSTKYERKWKDQGQTEFYRLEFRKTAHPTIPRPEIITVKYHTLESFDPERFDPQSQREPYTVQFRTFLYDPLRQVGVQEVFARESDLDQHFWVQIRKAEKGWAVHPAGGPPLLPLPSVQRALDLIKEAAEHG